MTPLFVEVIVELTLGQVAALKPWLVLFVHDYGRLLGIGLNLLIAEWLLRKKVIVQPKAVITSGAETV